jgi:hypothetical protein
MDNFLNFVYDDWDEVNDVPRPNRLKEWVHPDDTDQTWMLSTEPMRVYTRTQIKNWKLSDVPNHPDKMFYYHVWNRNGWNNRFFADDNLPIDKEVIRMIKTNKNLALIIMNECEFEKKQALERLDKIVKKLRINPKQVWFIHNGEKLTEHKEELNAQINVHTSRSMCTSVQGTHPPVKYRTLKTPNQFFLCHNRTPRIQRIGLLCLLKKYGILEDTNWSLINGWHFHTDSKIQFVDIFRYEDVLGLIDEIQYFTAIDIKKSNYETQYAELDDREVQRLPSEPNSYENSYVNITTETNFKGEDIHITEKSFKPFFYFQYPLILASYHHLKYFREAYPELDFFDDVIDHSYDDKENDRDRLIAFVEEIKRIHENKEFFIDFYKTNKHRFQKNHDILKDYQNDYDYEFFKKLSEVKPEEEEDVDIHLVYDNWNEELQEPYDMNCKEIYTDSFLMNLDSFVRSLGFPEERMKRYPLRDVSKYPNRKFYYVVTLTPNQIGNKIRDRVLPFPQEVIDCWRENPNFNVILGNEQEYESFGTFKFVHFWTKFNKLNQNQIWISNNNIRLEDYKAELNSEMNVYATSKVRTHIALAMMGVMPTLEYTTEKEGKFFLCHNRRVRPHRYALLVLLKRFGILDDTDWSLVNGWDAKERFHNNPKGLYSAIFTDEDIETMMDDLMYFININQKKSFYEEDKNWFREDNVNYVNWGETYESLSYKNSYLNITTETEFDTTEIHVTEKSFKPFVAYQFPLILASPNHIREIRKRYNFDWFDDIIDHSYDSITDHRERLFAFAKEIKRINDNKEFFIDFYKNNKQRFEKNHKIAYKLTYDTSDRDFLKKLTGLYEYEFKTGIRVKEKELL